MIFTLFIVIQFAVTSESLTTIKWCDQVENSIESVINAVIGEISQKINECIVFILDPVHYQLNLDYNRNYWKLNTHYVIAVKENEVFDSPHPRINTMLRHSKNSGCNAYVILIANGLQTIQLLQYGERERVLNIQGYFLLMHDERLFIPTMKYMWNRIINVAFIRQFNSRKLRSGNIIHEEWFNLETVSYPIQHDGFVVTHYIDTWYRNQFRFGNDHFPTKTKNLQNKKMKVALFEHIPAVTTHSRDIYVDNKNYSYNALGIEFEIIRIVANMINFRPVFYRPPNVEIEKWGTSDDNGSYNGLLGEAMRTNAAFFLGDFYYTLLHHSILELSYPYNTECLTFLTPESLTQNSWKLLIIPFTLYTWITVISIFIVGAYILHLISRFYLMRILPFKKINTPDVSNVVITLLEKTKHSQKRDSVDMKLNGLKMFTEMQTGFLYTYGMLLQVSLPRMTQAWAPRVFIGWWWLYSILITVVYRASMTATLANPVARVTIDTLHELAKSSITVGGWGVDKRELFMSSMDKDLNRIGGKFQLYDNEETAIAEIANGTFGYYENIHVLQEARAKRQLLEAIQNKKAVKTNGNVIADRNLHIMQECVIHMPIAIGMDRNSPLKPHVDQLVRKIVESGLVGKWQSDVMEWSKIVEIRYDCNMPKALIDLHKLYGALVVLAVGYLLGFVILAAENIYWRYVVMRNPAYDKYQMDAFYATINKAK